MFKQGDKVVQVVEKELPELSYQDVHEVIHTQMRGADQWIFIDTPPFMTWYPADWFDHHTYALYLSKRDLKSLLNILEDIEGHNKDHLIQNIFYRTSYADLTVVDKLTKQINLLKV